MPTVSNINLKYTTKGAKQAQRADQNVRQQTQKTAQQAEKNQQSTQRWMERNRGAINKMSMATMGFLGGLLYASPRVRGTLENLKSVFSMFADEIIRNVFPNVSGLTEKAMDLYDRFQKLSEPMQKFVSKGLIVAGVAGLLASAIHPAIGALFGVYFGIETVAGILPDWAGAILRLMSPLHWLKWVLQGIWDLLQNIENFKWTDLIPSLGGSGVGKVPIIGTVMKKASGQMANLLGMDTRERRTSGVVAGAKAGVGKTEVKSDNREISIENNFEGLKTDEIMDEINRQVENIIDNELGDERLDISPT